MKKFLISLATIFCCTLVIATFASCDNDDNETAGPYQYSMGYSKIESSEALSETSTISNAFREALGVQGSTFQYNNDAAVVAACKKAETTLNGMTFKGSYTFVITNESTLKKVFTWSNSSK